MGKEKACAIVPSYNEGGRIRKVLIELKKSKFIDEIIVVDDCSKDRTKEAIRGLSIKYIRNYRNLGKCSSLDKAIKKTNASVLFFCDADLKKFSSKMVDKILRPVLNKKHDMVIGIRKINSHFSNLNLFLLSGQRALRKKTWEQMPKYYKRRFRGEIGLNLHAKKIGVRVLNYGQYRKEQKEMGFIEGMKRKVAMYNDVLSAMAHFYIGWLFRKRSK